MTDTESKVNLNPTELSFDKKSKLLISRLSTLFKNIHTIQIEAIAVNQDSSLFPLFRGRYKLLDGLYTDFLHSWNTLYELYLLHDKEKQFPMDEKKRTQVDTWISDCHSTYECIMNPVPQFPTSNQGPNLTNATMHDCSLTAITRARLPKIQIPKFYGDPLTWQQFRDMFVALVHNEPTITAIEKFHYLVNSLSDEPSQIVLGFPLSDNNYEAAWNALNKRYNNKRILASTYLQRIRQFKLNNKHSSGIGHLRSFLKIVAESFTALKALNIPNEGDYFKLYLALDCLDPETRKLYETNQHGQDFPTYESFIEFIQQRCQILELSSFTSPDFSIPTSGINKTSRPKVLTTVNPAYSPKRSQPSQLNCPKCKENHFLFKCPNFHQLTATQRVELVRKFKLCFNCLRPGHRTPDCTSSYLCRHCNHKHHSLIHDVFIQSDTPIRSIETSPTSSNTYSNSNVAPSNLVGTATGSQQVILGTAVVHMRDWQGHYQPTRIVIDSGSQFSIITSDCAKRLGLPWIPTKRIVSGIGCLPKVSAKGTVHCTLRPINGNHKELQTNALVLSTITSNLPSSPLDMSLSEKLQTVTLADQAFFASRPIEFLLGSDLFLQIISSEPVIKITDKFGTLPTIFGHVVMGIPPDPSSHINDTCLTMTDFPISDNIMQTFWEIEEPLPSNLMHPDDVLCEDHFQRHVTRLSTGRYMVALPFRNSDHQFPTSKQSALKRFRNLELRFDKDHTLRDQYSSFVQEYLDLHHMQEAISPSAYIIPHHPVFKPDLTQPGHNKIRVVFDASMKAPEASLNDQLLVGPKLQRDLTSIILNFRTHRVAFCTDIVKMYRQILIQPADRCYQHILWRASPEEPIRIYELCTVTYGLASSPFLALRVLQQLVNDEGDQYPEAAQVLRNNIYVDDIITGADLLDQALRLKNDITSILSRGGFSVHKWASNSRPFLNSIQNTSQSKVDLPANDLITKVLGIYWDAESDLFSYHVDLKPTSITKRTILSVIARLFDPLGLIAPIIFIGKTIMQQLWLFKLGWDDPPPVELLSQWNEFLSELSFINKITISRWLHLPTNAPMIFGFCDASEKGYAAALYIRVLDMNSLVRTFLLKAKTKLAPVKTMCIARLELCGAYLLTKLLRSVNEFCHLVQANEILLFTDSTIVLSWLGMIPSTLKTFVANRVGYILTYTTISQWYHVPTTENPADVASRGMPTRLLIDHSLWWNGPLWMRNNPLILPPLPPVLASVPELKQTVVTLIQSEPPVELHNTILSKSFSHRKIIRITAYIFRFIRIIRKLPTPLSDPQPNNTLTLLELQQATNYLIQQTQHQYFDKDFDFISRTPLSIRFKALAAFLDETGVLRVGGRLANAQLPYSQKHPILLPPQALYTKLLIDSLHLQHFHLGLSALQAYLQRSYYIFKLRSLLRKQIWSCVRCFKAKATPVNPFMGDLPISRVSQGRPFINVGIDFAGPFHIKVTARRNAPTSKAYLCVFVCMAVKATHLEIVSALTTDAFLASFDRFISRRGLPTNIYSDCGSNFIGASRHLHELFDWYKQNLTQQKITDHLANLGINWHFNPPYTPHFGGLWEAAVKTAKSHLRKIVGDTAFYFEELNTLFIRIEAIMNSRPLVCTSTQPDNYDYLTPGHFLIGSPIIAPPEYDITTLKLNTLSRWQLIQHSAQHFWKRWSNEYLKQLHIRSKWRNHNTNTWMVNDVVLIQDPHTPLLSWKLGRIVDLHPGKDGITRVVTVQTPAGCLKRAVHKLALLPHCRDHIS